MQNAALAHWPTTHPWITVGGKSGIHATRRRTHFTEAAVLVTVTCAAHGATQRRCRLVRRKLHEKEDFVDVDCPELFKLQQPVRPGRVSAKRSVPATILRPRYLQPGTRMDLRDRKSVV